MLIKTVLKSDGFSKVNVIDLSPKKWTTLHPNCMLNISIQIILNKSLSVLSALFDLIHLDLRF